MSTRSPFVLCVRLTPDEYQAFTRLAQKMHETRSALLRKAIREMINNPISDLLQEEQILVRVVIRHLAGIGNNLNQIAHAVNSGVIPQQRVDVAYLDRIQQQVFAVKSAFRQYLTVTRQRRIIDTQAS